MDVCLNIVVVTVAVAMTTVHTLSSVDRERRSNPADTYMGKLYVSVSNGDILKGGSRCADDPVMAVWSILLKGKKFTCSGSLNVAQWMTKNSFWERRDFADYIGYLKFESGIICSYTKGQNGPDFKYPVGPNIQNICTYDPIPGRHECHRRCRYELPEPKTEPPPCRLSNTPYDSKCESTGEFALGAMILDNATYGCNYEWNVGVWESGQTWTEGDINYAFGLPFWDVRCCYPTGVKIPWRHSDDGGQEHWIEFDRNCNVRCNYEAPC